ncbi:asparagine synthase (glutamine-hydrolyzing) [Romboutsia sp. CE17]|uniref:asparagine synthase (glutamine-hydrolyzing) n=1 Tax=Romboutsia sp. CE17 TaxID=2724150 RepID=UPI001442D0DC|nr:asparagine synthase (glutamine-hydrolyzing) [Romboutsia sp. CE17]QJA09237.1 asparagine synthase (glutamine-hydrolyzing) [Romboutsia sp. CE17]
MCGFVGFVSKANNKKYILKDMLDTIIHRGPDQTGEFINEDVALGFRRLSIIDVTHGAQPLFNEDKSIALVFNGEIYNYKDLREELIQRGHIFKTDTDSEVLVHSYEEYKEDMVQKLRGMFAFVIFDTKNKKLFGARDHFGIKPFYYTSFLGKDEKSFLFGSEIKSFLKHPDFVKELNKDALKPYLTFQYSVLNETFFKGVFKLPPAHYFTYENEKMEIKRYWDINFDEKENTLENYINEVKHIVNQSVEVHKNSEVPLGSFLSGGVDSSYITSVLMPQKTFSVGFEQDKFNESNLAKDLSNMLEIENLSKIINAEECFNKLDCIQYHMDEPQANPSSIPLYFLSELAREHVTVVLSGEGADELFGGYEWYDETSVMKKYKKVPKPLRKLLAKLVKNKPYFKGKMLMIKGGSDVEDYFIGQAFVFEEDEAKDILNKEYSQSPSIKDITKPIYEKVKDKDDLTKKQYLDLNLWLPGDILLKADKMSMAHSLELRVPFLDKEVMKVAQDIPRDYRVNDENTKYVLRKAANEVLPDEWAKREKKGFPVPIREWLKEEKYHRIVKESFESDYAREFFDTTKIVKLLDNHYNGNENNARKIWVIYIFLVWYKRFFIDEDKSIAL